MIINSKEIQIKARKRLLVTHSQNPQRLETIHREISAYEKDIAAIKQDQEYLVTPEKSGLDTKKRLFVLEEDPPPPPPLYSDHEASYEEDLDRESPSEYAHEAEEQSYTTHADEQDYKTQEEEEQEYQTQEEKQQIQQQQKEYQDDLIAYDWTELNQAFVYTVLEDQFQRLIQSRELLSPEVYEDIMNRLYPEASQEVFTHNRAYHDGINQVLEELYPRVFSREETTTWVMGLREYVLHNKPLPKSLEELQATVWARINRWDAMETGPSVVHSEEVEPNSNQELYLEESRWSHTVAERMDIVLRRNLEEKEHDWSNIQKEETAIAFEIADTLLDDLLGELCVDLLG